MRRFGIISTFLLALSGELPAQVINSFAIPSSETSPLLRSNIVNKIAPKGDTIWVGTGKGPTSSTDAGRSWRQFAASETFDEKGVSAVAARGNEIWISTTYITKPENVAHQTGHGLHYSTDRGQSWTFISQPVDTGKVDTLLYGRNKIPTLNVTVPVDNVTYDIALTSKYVWIASWAGMLRRSSNRGKSWERVILPPDNLNRISPSDTLRFALAVVDRQLGADSLVGNLNHRPFAVYASDDSTIWVGTANGINKSTDGGISWRKFNHQNQLKPISGNWVVGITEQRWGTKRVIWAATVNALEADEKRGVSYSSDGGETWGTALLGEWAHNIASKDSIVYVATDGGVYRSNDYGRSWTRSGTVYDPLTLQRFASPAVYAVGVQGDALWTGGPEGLARTLDNSSSPFGSTWNVFRTYQPVQATGQTYSYPLPFSPAFEAVRIHFSTSGKTAPVSIRIFDFSMQPVKTLLRDALRIGSAEHDEIWDGRDDRNRRVTNGVYFYRIEVDGGNAQWGKIFVLQ
ncbi:MAG: hypothetical protein NTU47_18350 [Ignavibacteriales bacterium]|nr:hypothetical protein [Ignavibacteriales bacterium]